MTPTPNASPSAAALPHRCVAQQLADAVAEELVVTGGIEDASPAMRERYEALCRALADPDTPDAGFRCHVGSFVAYVEVCYRAYLGRPVLLGGALGDAYDAAVARLRADGVYPLRWSRRWHRYRDAYEGMQALRARSREREQDDFAGGGDGY